MAAIWIPSNLTLEANMQINEKLQNLYEEASELTRLINGLEQDKIHNMYTFGVLGYDKLFLPQSVQPDIYNFIKSRCYSQLMSVHAQIAAIQDVSESLITPPKNK